MSHGEIEREIIGMRLRGLTYRQIEELTGFSRIKINKIWKGYKRLMGMNCGRGGKKASHNAKSQQQAQT